MTCCHKADTFFVHHSSTSNGICQKMSDKLSNSPLLVKTFMMAAETKMKWRIAYQLHSLTYS